MFKAAIFRGVGRAVIRAPALRSSPNPFNAASLAAARRSFSVTASIRKDDEGEHGEYEKMLTGAKPGAAGDHEGSFSRTDKRIQVEYPEEADYPKAKPVQGRGGYHFKRTLASFSLEDKVAIVTGGARGLGLVMSQACVVSGADVAIVDLNSEWRVNGSRNSD